MTKKIIVTITSDGEVTTETKGFRGKGCITDSKFVKEALGEVAETKLTSDYYLTEVINKEKNLA
jgi:bifunctional N-acetylglucosamine-1-phosphate-uridyltransferase/glucosamine-1-phosphate-acetyltransferase GlmU-like protein